MILSIYLYMRCFGALLQKQVKLVINAMMERTGVQNRRKTLKKPSAPIDAAHEPIGARVFWPTEVNEAHSTCLWKFICARHLKTHFKISTCSTRLYLEGKGPHGSCGRQRNRLGEEIREDTACADRRNPAPIGATALFARNRVFYE